MNTFTSDIHFSKKSIACRPDGFAAGAAKREQKLWSDNGTHPLSQLGRWLAPALPSASSSVLLIRDEEGWKSEGKLKWVEIWSQLAIMGAGLAREGGSKVEERAEKNGRFTLLCTIVYDSQLLWMLTWNKLTPVIEWKQICRKLVYSPLFRQNMNFTISFHKCTITISRYTGGQVLMMSKVLRAFLDSVVQFSEQNRHWTVDIINTWPPVSEDFYSYTCIRARSRNWLPFLDKTSRVLYPGAGMHMLPWDI